MKPAVKVPAGLELVIHTANQGIDVSRLQQRFTEGDVFVVEWMPARQLHTLGLREIVDKGWLSAPCTGCGEWGW